jgi:hypothetical protein
VPEHNFPPHWENQSQLYIDYILEKLHPFLGSEIAFPLQLPRVPVRGENKLGRSKGTRGLLKTICVLQSITELPLPTTLVMELAWRVTLLQNSGMWAEVLEWEAFSIRSHVPVRNLRRCHLQRTRAKKELVMLGPLSGLCVHRAE